MIKTEIKTPTKLYKSCPFNIYSLRAISQAENFYTAPNDFNDPLDCDPGYINDLELADLQRGIYSLYFIDMTKSEAADRISNHRYNATEYGDPKTGEAAKRYLAQVYAQEARRFLKARLGIEGVFCLSQSWRSVLMWSHYADHHKGICIEYDVTGQSHGRLFPARYGVSRSIKISDIIACWVRSDTEAKRRILETYFYAKSGQWRYEKEWRDVKDKAGPHESEFSITGIMFGYRCDPAAMSAIVKLLSDRRDISLWDVYPRRDSFNLMRASVDRDEAEHFAIRRPSFEWLEDFEDLEGSADETGG